MSAVVSPASRVAKPSRCAHCGGSMYLDPLDECWVCFLCARTAPCREAQPAAKETGRTPDPWYDDLPARLKPRRWAA